MYSDDGELRALRDTIRENTSDKTLLLEEVQDRSFKRETSLGQPPRPRFFSPSIDRIVPALGYTPENCRFILWAVNAFKHDGTDDDMYRVAEALIAARKSVK